MRHGFAAVLLVAWSMPALSDAQTLPKLHGGSVRARVERVGSGYFEYQYRLASRATESLRVCEFTVDVVQSVDRAALGIAGLPPEAPMVLPRSVAARKETIDKAVGLSISGIPSGWSAGVDREQRVRWGSNSASSRLSAGGQLTGFEISSHGLPGLRDGRLEPDLDGLLPNVEEHPELEFIYDEVPATAQVAPTVGPVAPPAIFTPRVFIDEIEAMLDEARRQGWIDSEEAKKLLADKLDEIEASLDAGHDDDARSSASAFIALVSSMSCTEFDCGEDRALSSEAYALLRFNMESLRDRL